MPKRKRRFPKTMSSSFINGSSKDETRPTRVEMPLRRVVSESTGGNNIGNEEMQDQEEPYVESMTESVNADEKLLNIPTHLTEMEHRSRWRVSVRQLEFLAHCMEQFPALALSLAKGREALYQAHRKWGQIAAALNQIEPRVAKTGKGWLRYWADLKFKVRRKYACERRFAPRERSRLTPFEKRLIRILTDNDGNLLVNAATTGQRDQREIDDDCLNTDEDTSRPAPPEQVDVPSSPDSTPSGEEERVPPTTPTEDPIGIEKRTAEELQTDILQYSLARQKEMHELEMAQMRERHKCEMEILELKKERLKQAVEREMQLFITVQQSRRSGGEMN